MMPAALDVFLIFQYLRNSRGTETEGSPSEMVHESLRCMQQPAGKTYEPLLLRVQNPRIIAHF